MTSKTGLKYFRIGLIGKLVMFVFILKLFSIFLPFEFSNNEFRESFKFYHNAIFILLLFTFISFEILRDKALLKIWGRILLLIPLVVIFLITVIMVLFLGDCKHEEVGIMYVERNGNATVSRRSINCGATTDYSYDIYYIKPITPFFNFRWRFDDKNIDTSEWIKPFK